MWSLGAGGGGGAPGVGDPPTSVTAFDGVVVQSDNTKLPASPQSRRITSGHTRRHALPRVGGASRGKLDGFLGCDVTLVVLGRLEDVEHDCRPGGAMHSPPLVKASDRKL